MGYYAITGGATGIGAALGQLLRAQGHEVLVVDIQAADVRADLSTREGRDAAVSAILDWAPEGLDGVVPCAGLSPVVRPRDHIDRVNYFGALAILGGLRGAVARRRGAMVAVSSNSAPLPGLDQAHVERLLAGDEEGACARVAELDGHNAYAGAKHALALWVRRHAPAYMADGVRLNAVAPGMTRTPMTEQVLADHELGPLMEAYARAIPYGDAASPDMVAASIAFLLSPAARFVSGVVLFVDGGQDAAMRPQCY